MTVKGAIARPPRDRDELWHCVAALWGIVIPRTPVCPGHSTPFEAFAQAYFAEYPVIVWEGSRGFAGKTNTLALLALTEAALLGAQSTVLGGSGAQSLRVHEASQEAWTSPNAPKSLLEKEPTTYSTHLVNGAWIRTLMASQTSVRGPHPQRLRLDEIDEMDLSLLEAAQGQPMRGTKGRQKGIETQTVMSSTHQNPDGTMTEILKRAKQNGWPHHTWCYLETSNPIDGWLTAEEIERKKNEVTKAMWDIEYDLQEPSFEGRAIDTAAVEAMFDKDQAVFTGDLGQRHVFENPITHPGQKHKWPYVTATDWAKEKDWTITATFRTDTSPWQCVAWKRDGRRPWPVMVADAEKQWNLYGGKFIHDATGLGNVVSDLLSADKRYVEDQILSGKERSQIFSEYISAVESGDIKYPFIEFAYNEHKYVTLDDLYGRGHPPDSVVAGALAWHLRPKHNQYTPVAPVGIKKTPAWSI